MLQTRFYPIALDYVTAERYIVTGVKFLQIRLKGLSPSETEYHLSKAVSLAKKYEISLVINDYWEYALVLGADWIHLGQEDLQNADFKKIKQAGLKFGLSTHDTQELQTALACNPNYIALGPIYFTNLKAMKWQPQGLDIIKSWKQQCGTIPLVAIGGITLENADAVLNAGADCVSCVTDISNHANPDLRLKQWIEKFSSQ